MLSGFGQSVAPTPPSSSPAAETRQRSSTSSENGGGNGTGAAAKSPAFTKRARLAFKKRLSGSQKRMLAPDQADVNHYAAFLQNETAGLFKIFPDLGCEANASIVRADEICLQQIPMSAFYSFREKEHTTDYLSDIRLENDLLITDGLLTQGILVALGEIPLETVTSATKGLSFLAAFKPEAQNEQALTQIYQVISGIESGGFIYRKSIPARINMTYALRVVAYRGRIIQTFRGFPFNMIEGDDRADVTVVFRLVKKDAATGSYTVLWKELARQNAPKMIFPKRNKRKQSTK